MSDYNLVNIISNKLDVPEPSDISKRPTEVNLEDINKIRNIIDNQVNTKSDKQLTKNTSQPLNLNISNNVNVSNIFRQECSSLNNSINPPSNKEIPLSTKGIEVIKPVLTCNDIPVNYSKIFL